MRPLRIALALAAAVAAPNAVAQISNHGIALESGISSPLGGSGGPGATFAVSASAWIDGDLEGFARVAFSSAGETQDRAAVPSLAGTVGLRLSLGRAPVRPQVFAEAGWAQVEAERGGQDRATFGLGGGLEVFPVLDLSVSARAALRVTAGAPALEAVLCLAGYF
jgi:hypothetical protein